MLFRARKRRLVALSSSLLAGVALAALPAGAAADVDVSAPSRSRCPGCRPPRPRPFAIAVRLPRRRGPPRPRLLGHAAPRDAVPRQPARAPAPAAPRFRHERRLARAAARHASDMGRRDYFAHVSPSGQQPARARPRRRLARRRRRGHRLGLRHARHAARDAARLARQPAAPRDHPRRRSRRGRRRQAPRRLRRPRLLGRRRRLTLNQGSDPYLRVSGAGGPPCRPRP